MVGARDRWIRGKCTQRHDRPGRRLVGAEGLREAVGLGCGVALPR